MASSNFELKVAFVGYKLDGKSTTLLAAMLKDFYSDISTPTAGVNYFRIGTSTNLDGAGGGGSGTAESICYEIAQENKAALANDDPIRLQEKMFDIVMDMDDPICEMREDTSLVFVDVPGISLVEDCRYRNFLDNKWDTFDCVVLVLDCVGDGQTENQTLLRHVRKRNYENKQVPVIVVCNQFEDTDDEEQARQVGQLEALIKEVFGERDRDKKYDQVAFSVIPILGYDSDEEASTEIGKPNRTLGQPLLAFSFDDSENNVIIDRQQKKENGQRHNKDQVVDLPILVPVLTRRAFLYRLSSRLSLEQINQLDAEALDKIGRDEVGNFHWNQLSQEEKYKTVFAALHDVSQNEERLKGTGFQEFREQLRKTVGGIEVQTNLLKAKKRVALTKLSSVTTIVDDLRLLHEQYATIKDDETAGFTEKFWELYNVSEEAAFIKLESDIDVGEMALPINLLKQYKELIEGTGWENPYVTVSAIRNLVRRQLRLVLNKHSLWSYEEWYKAMNAESWTKNKKLSHRWECLSPADWGAIMSSILLSSCDKNFYEYFGNEKMSLERYLYLSNDLLAAPPPTVATSSNAKNKSKQSDGHFAPVDGCPSLDHALAGVYEKEAFIPKYRQTFECVVGLKPPDLLSDPSHWGYAAWSYANLARSLERSFSHKQNVMAQSLYDASLTSNHIELRSLEFLRRLLPP